MAVDPQGSAHDRARIVRRYLSALDARKPGRTNARTQELVALRMHQVDVELLSADPLARLHLTQERIDLHAEQLRLNTASNDFDELERAFTRVARGYGERHDVTYSAWRQVGVDAAVLAKAGITQNARPPRPAEAKGAEAPKQGAKQPDTAKKAQAPAKAEPQPAKYKPAAKKDEGAKSQASKTDSAPKPTTPPPAPSAKKQAPAAKKAAPSAKKAPAKKAANGEAKKQGAPKDTKAQDAKPQQQQLPAEVHLLG